MEVVGKIEIRSPIGFDGGFPLCGARCGVQTAREQLGHYWPKAVSEHSEELQAGEKNARGKRSNRSGKKRRD